MNARNACQCKRCCALAAFSVALLLLRPVLLSAQEERASGDTVRISLAEAERRFLNTNQQLLAARYSIDAARAAIIQAQLWNNPNLAIEQNVYNQTTRRYFDFTRDGNTELQLQQLLLLGGKRSKQVRLAEINSEVAEDNFYDLSRSLKLELRSDFFDLYFAQQEVGFYDQSIATLGKTVEASERIFRERSILLSDVLRLKTLMFSLQDERLGLLNRISDIEGRLRILLKDSTGSFSYFVPRVDSSRLGAATIDTLTLPGALRAAIENRPDVRIADANVHYEEANLALQKSLAIPDVTIGGRWSRSGSYIPEYYALSVAIDLPLFNRNQGNIQVSERTLEADVLTRDNVRITVENEVVTAFRKARETDRLFRESDRNFPAEYRTLVDGMIESYRMRNISLLQFTDFYEAYRSSVIQINQLQNDRVDAYENLNFAVGKDLVKTQ